MLSETGLIAYGRRYTEARQHVRLKMATRVRARDLP